MQLWTGRRCGVVGTRQSQTQCSITLSIGTLWRGFGVRKTRIRGQILVFFWIIFLLSLSSRRGFHREGFLCLDWSWSWAMTVTRTTSLFNLPSRAWWSFWTFSLWFLLRWGWLWTGRYFIKFNGTTPSSFDKSIWLSTATLRHGLCVWKTRIRGRRIFGLF